MAHLTRGANEAAELTQLEPLAQRVAQAMQQLLASFTKGAFTISAGTANAARYPEWRIAQNPFGAVLRYRLPKRGDEMLVHLPGFLVCQIVDVYYGGSGNVQARGEFSAAEMRFHRRLWNAAGPASKGGNRPGSRFGNRIFRGRDRSAAAELAQIA